MKKGDLFKDKDGNIIAVGAIFTDGIISGYCGKTDRWWYYQISYLTFYKSAEEAEQIFKL